MVAHARRFDDAPGPHEDVVADPEGRVDDSAALEAVRGPQDAVGREEGVAAYGDGGAVGCGWGGGAGGVVVSGGGGGGGGSSRRREGGVDGGGGGGGGKRKGRKGRGGTQVAADADARLDDGAAAEEDVLGAVELGLAGDLVAGFGLDVVAARGGAGFRWHCPFFFFFGLVWFGLFVVVGWGEGVQRGWGVGGSEGGGR